MQKRKLLLFIVLLIIQILSMNVFADHAVPNLNIDGSITIHMNNGDKPLKGGSLTFYQVGRIKESNGNYSFTLTDEFSASELELKNVQSAELANKLRDFARKNSCLNKNIAIKNGIAKINVSKGELGLYFVVQNKACNGYKLMNPFLISAPNMVNGNYVYEVNAYSKMGLPEIKPEVSPEPSPEVSPEPSPEVSPEPSPEVSHEPSPEVSPEPSPEVSPNPDKPVQPVRFLWYWELQ